MEVRGCDNGRQYKVHWRLSLLEEKSGANEHRRVEMAIKAGGIKIGFEIVGVDR